MWELTRAGVPCTADRRRHGGEPAPARGRDLRRSSGPTGSPPTATTANKIGTYALALAARAHGVPFYVAAPQSTFDPATPDGAAIPIEERRAEEITMLGGSRIAAEGVAVWNPGVRRDTGSARHRRSSPTAALLDRRLDEPPSSRSTRAPPGRPRWSCARTASVLGRGYREFTQHFPEPGWVEHDPLGDCSRSRSRRCARRWPRRGRARRRSASPTSGRRSCSGTGGRLEPVARAIVWQDRRTTARCRELREAGSSRCSASRTGLVADPYFSATKLEWLLRDPALRAARRARRHRRGNRGELAGGAAHRRRLHVSDHTNASRTLLYDLATRDLGRRAPGAVRRAPRTAPRDRAFRRAWSATCASEHLGFRLPIAGLAGDQQSALFGQGCARTGMAKNTYGTGAFLLVHAGERACRNRPRACSARRRAVPGVSRPTRSRAACSLRAPPSSGSATAWASSRRRRRRRRSP